MVYTIGGSLQDVHHDLLVEEKAAHLGLQLNRSKSELICDVASTCDSMLSVVSDLRSVGSSADTLLGTPVGIAADLVGTTIKSKIRRLQMMEIFSLLKSKEALSLLRHSFAIPKVLYILGTTPCFLFRAVGGLRW